MVSQTFSPVVGINRLLLSHYGIFLATLLWWESIFLAREMKLRKRPREVTMRSRELFTAYWYPPFWVSFKESSTQTWDWLYHWRHGGIEFFENCLSGVLEHCHNVTLATVALSLSGFKMRAHIGFVLRFLLYLQLSTFPSSSTHLHLHPRIYRSTSSQSYICKPSSSLSISLSFYLFFS